MIALNQSNVTDVTRLFGQQASAYASFRPEYPAQLFDWMASGSPGLQRALDIGCGNGQASRELATRFEQTLACDSSLEQLSEARQHQGVQLFAADARQLPVSTHSIDLVTVAQALHWFEGPAFFAETQRILRPGGLFCAWCYGLMRINPEVDALIVELHGDLLQNYWPAGRATVDAGYSNILTDFPRIQVPPFAIELHWSLEHLLGYLRTWSAVQRWQHAHGKDPLDLFSSRLAQAWGNPAEKQFVCWPLHFVAGYPGNPLMTPPK